MSAFAKIFDTPHGQLLVTKDYDDEHEDAPYRINARGESNSVAQPSMGFGWESEEERDAAWDQDTNQQEADKIAAALHNAINNLFGGEGETKQ
jgi:hypothetical protein